MYRLDTYKDGKTVLSKGPEEIIASIETDFIIKPEMIPLELPLKEQGEIRGYIKTFEHPNHIEIYSAEKELISTYTNGIFKSGETKQRVKTINQYVITNLALEEKIPQRIKEKKLVEINMIKEATIYTFERGDELASLIDTEGDDEYKILSLIPLTLTKRIEEQEMIRLAHSYRGK